MDIPVWLKPGLLGAVAGGALVALAGFAVAGWMTASGARQMGQDMADAQVIAALIPVCVTRAETDPERAEKMATVRQATTSVRQRDALLAAGWATIDGNPAASRTLASACVAALEQRRSALPSPPSRAG